MQCSGSIYHLTEFVYWDWLEWVDSGGNRRCITKWTQVFKKNKKIGRIRQFVSNFV